MIFACATSFASAQYTSVRVNALALVTGSVNVGVDVALGEKVSADLSASWSPFSGVWSAASGDNMSFTAGVKHWRFEPNVGLFWGLHTTTKRFTEDEKVGWAFGCGSSVGYSWILSQRWNFGVECGLGLYYLHDKWLLLDTSMIEDIIIRHRDRLMVLPSKCEVSFSYMF